MAFPRKKISSSKSMIVAPQPEAVETGIGILKSGGNAIDAGVAAGLASNVVQVDMANFGGIAPILIRTAGSSQAYSVAGVGRWSRSASIAEMLSRHNGSLPLDGAPAIVPGAPSAWINALRRYGTMSFGEVSAPAIQLAENGFLLDESLARSFEITGKNFRKWSSSSAIYRPNDIPLIGRAHV